MALLYFLLTCKEPIRTNWTRVSFRCCCIISFHWVGISTGKSTNSKQSNPSFRRIQCTVEIYFVNIEVLKSQYTLDTKLFPFISSNSVFSRYMISGRKLRYWKVRNKIHLSDRRLRGPSCRHNTIETLEEREREKISPGDKNWSDWLMIRSCITAVSVASDRNCLIVLVLTWLMTGLVMRWRLELELRNVIRDH